MSPKRIKGERRRTSFDHLDLVDREPITCERLRSTVRLGRGTVLDLDVMHEADDSCCRREPWLVTLAAVLAGGEP